MASAPQSLPLFYNALEPLSSETHAAFKMRMLDRATFLVGQHAIPITVDEFVMAQRTLPIVFTSGDDAIPIALMGLNEGVNVFIGDDGKLTEDTVYVPAYVRRYPFMLARLRPDAEELSLCFDPTGEAIGAFDDGEALFADGKPTEVVQNILGFNEQFEQAGARTANFMSELREMGLLMEGEVTLQVEGNEQPFIYRGFQMVNEEKLNELRGDQLRKIQKSGLLPLIYAHLFSLSTLPQIFDRQVKLGKAPVPQLVN
ncbi:multidrug transporter [Sphingomonas sp. AAP5]|uniref:Peptidase n=1 Tax=Sphingomonas glacialis TaxID=658225 RepID=A0ABQ3LQ14_9SPHN|nr:MULTISPECIES: SapC family protein [Sphingomonas]MDY7523355.1 SapC family protein [Sphingomonas sp. 10B4]MEB0281053.1 SapC family protein [Sphingomonas sp. 10B4]QBM76468.1 multidrug transporter [Sphingomonas sp. AAP5]GHH22892.1 peptidase [Sphingomonas glacialis]